MGEADETETPDDSDTTEGEQEEAAEETPDVEEDPIETPEEETPDVEEETVEEKTESTESDEQDVPGNEVNNETNAVADSDTTIAEVIKEGDNEAAGTAQIVYLGGCVSGGKLAEGRALKFRVEPADGHALVSVTVNKVDGETKTEVKSTPDTDGVYTVSYTHLTLPTK